MSTATLPRKPKATAPPQTINDFSEVQAAKQDFADTMAKLAAVQSQLDPLLSQDDSAVVDSSVDAFLKSGDLQSGEKRATEIERLQGQLVILRGAVARRGELLKAAQARATKDLWRALEPEYRDRAKRLLAAAREFVSACHDEFLMVGDLRGKGVIPSQPAAPPPMINPESAGKTPWQEYIKRLAKIVDYQP